MKKLTRKQIRSIISVSLAVILVVTLGCVFGIRHTVTLEFGVEGYVVYPRGNLSYIMQEMLAELNASTSTTEKVHIYNTSYVPPNDTYSTVPKHTFAGWYKDYGRTVPWLSTDKVTRNITLYARWVIEE